MGTCSRLATMLDAEMLNNHSVSIWYMGTSDSTLLDPYKIKSGSKVAMEIGDRYLMRFLLPFQVAYFDLSRYPNRPPSSFLNARHYVTPTPFTPEEAVPWLALPSPDLLRTYVMLIDPERVDEIGGPRLVRFGGGIEYIIKENNLKIDSIVDIGADPTRPSKWPLLVT